MTNINKNNVIHAKETVNCKDIFLAIFNCKQVDYISHVRHAFQSGLVLLIFILKQLIFLTTGTGVC